MKTAARYRKLRTVSSQRKTPKKVSPEKLYQVVSPYFCAGMTARNGKIIKAAPILRKLVMGKGTLAAIDACKANYRWFVNRIINGQAYPR